MINLLRWLWPIAPMIRLSWGTTRIPNPYMDVMRGRAFLLRGTAAIFSPRFGRLCDRLRTIGVIAEDLRSIGAGWIVRSLMEARERGEQVGPIILIGHSRGGRGIITAATQLVEVGIAVDLLIGVDVAFAAPIPSHVRRAVHLYRTGWRLYPARAFHCADESSRTHIENLDLDAVDPPISGRWLNHVTITASEGIQTWIVSQVEEMLTRSSAE